jgi:hypothetical protein
VDTYTLLEFGVQTGRPKLEAAKITDKTQRQPAAMIK